jgi:hypothetical protein
MKKTRVVHCQKEEYDVYIGRPGPYGNPFYSGTRKEVIEKYSHWFYLPEQAELRERAKKELKGKVLGCWCKPKACHGDVLADFVNGLFGG